MYVLIDQPIKILFEEFVVIMTELMNAASRIKIEDLGNVLAVYVESKVANIFVHHQHTKKPRQVSLVKATGSTVASFPGAGFILGSCRLGTLLLCDTWGRRVNCCLGEDSCSSQTAKEGSESTLLVAILRSLFLPQTER